MVSVLKSAINAQKNFAIFFNNLSFGFICPLDLRESPRRAEIVMGFILKNMDPVAILSIRGFDAAQRADKPKTQVNIAFTRL